MANVLNYNVLASKTVKTIGTQGHVVVKLGTGLYATAYVTKGGDNVPTFITIRIIQKPNARNGKTIVQPTSPKTLSKGRRVNNDPLDLPFPDRRSSPHAEVGKQAVNWNRELMNSLAD
jgi:hypothetical protein